MTGRDSVDIDVIELVSNQRRRYVLQCLTGRDAGMAMADLATDVAALEADADPSEVSPEAVERVYVSLHHCHVPKLVDGDVVECDQERNVVSLASADEETEKVRQITERVAVRRRA